MEKLSQNEIKWIREHKENLEVYKILFIIIFGSLGLVLIPSFIYYIINFKSFAGGILAMLFDILYILILIDLLKIKW